MTLQQFRVLDAIATSGNFSRAALELSTSQPALSHQLKLLQLSYGAKLYSRTPAGIVLTDAGEMLLAEIRPILKLVDKLKKGSAPVMERKFASMVLRTGGTFSACAVLLPTLIERLQHLHPRARLECRTSTSEQLERSVINRKMDVAVTARATKSRELAYEPLRPEKIVAFVPSDHPLARKKSLTGAELFSETLIIRGGAGITGTTENALRRFRKQGHEIKIGLRCDDPMAIRAAVRQKWVSGLALRKQSWPMLKLASSRFSRSVVWSWRGLAISIIRSNAHCRRWRKSFLSCFAPAVRNNLVVHHRPSRLSRAKTSRGYSRSMSTLLDSLKTSCCCSVLTLSHDRLLISPFG